MVIISFLSAKIPILCFEFQAWFYFFSRNFRFDGFQAEVTSFLHIKVPKIKKMQKCKKKKDENFKYSASMALNCFYIGQYLQ